MSEPNRTPPHTAHLGNRASRIANALARTPGVQGVVVADEAGEPLHSINLAEAAEAAALATLLARRCQAMVADFDLRGIGKQIQASRLAEAIAASDAGDLVVYALENLAVGVVMHPGKPAEFAAPKLRAALQRV